MNTIKAAQKVIDHMFQDYDFDNQFNINSVVWHSAMDEGVVLINLFADASAEEIFGHTDEFELKIGYDFDGADSSIDWDSIHIKPYGEDGLWRKITTPSDLMEFFADHKNSQ